MTNCQQTIISIHGGGWVYGDKDLYQFYCMDLAQRGFTVVNFSYRLAPEDSYPAAIEDINSVFTWVAEHAKEYNMDLNNLLEAVSWALQQLITSHKELWCLTMKKYFLK